MKNDFNDKLKEEKLNLEYDFLIKILDNTFGNVFVTDRFGKVVFVNDNTAQSFGLPRNEIIGQMAQDLVERGVITKSTSLEAIATRDIAISSLTTRTGDQLLNFSKPIFDDDGEISIVMTFGQQRSLMNEFMETIASERRRSEAYREALGRISGMNGRDNEVIVVSSKMKALYGQMSKVAQTDGIVMLYGESGVGKDVAANFIHRNSKREKEPFVPVNCAAIPLELMESEFFGYEKGAFTGALAGGKAGLFEMADKGTLFLDEIGELPLSVQAKFLRVVETGVVTRIGGEKMIRTNVRLIAATNRNLVDMVEQGTFRQDLFFRLNVLSFTIPPLRERREEIPIFAQHFLDSYNKKYAYSKEFSDKTLEVFQNYAWKGNIRELKNVVERLVLTSEENLLYVTSIEMSSSEKPAPSEHASSEHENWKNGGSALDTGRGVADTSGNASDEASGSLSSGIHGLNAAYWEEERKRVLAAMLACGGNKTKAAQLLGVSRGKLYRLLEK